MELTDLPAPLWPALLVHRGLRRDTGRLRAALDRPPCPARAAAIAGWFRRVRAVLDTHARGDVAHLWPAVTSGDPCLDAVVASLRDRHRAVERAVDVLADALDVLAETPPRRSAAVHAPAAAGAAEVAGGVHDLLEAEEREVFPAVVARLAADDPAVVAALERARPAADRFLAPFVLDGVDRADRDRLGRAWPEVVGHDDAVFARYRRVTACVTLLTL